MSLLSLSSFEKHSSIGSSVSGISEEAQIIGKKLHELNQHFNYPASRQSDYAKFIILTREWKQGTRYFSSSTQMFMHSAYQHIIGMGVFAVPYILNELKREPDHWYWALECITGINPIPQEDQGNLSKMREYWLNWGKLQGYV